MDDRYQQSRAAQKTGGPCPICGWRDGDGATVCFYDPILGAVTHTNTEHAAERTMTEQQRSLFRLRQALAFIDHEHREQYLLRTIAQNAARHAEHDRLHPTIPYCTAPDGTPITDQTWAEQFRATHQSTPLATDPRFSGWLSSPWWIQQPDPADPTLLTTRRDGHGKTWAAWMTHLAEPHPNCGGIQVQIGPYHLACSQCDTEIRLWEHGIDYDVG